MKIILWSLLFLFLLPLKAYTAIYKYIDSEGVIHFTDVPPDGKYTTVKVPSTSYSPSYYNKHDYREIAEETAKRYSVDPELVKRIIEVESGWNPYAISPKGAMGLMQIMPETARELGLKNPYDPEENIDAGVRYLKYLIRRFGDLRLALAAYNAGPSVVEQYGGVPPYSETIRYVRNILSGYGLESFNKRKEKIYKIVLKDGTILFTNSPVYTERIQEF
jgi:soluble lytic murein transglycosylase-like protein